MRVKEGLVPIVLGTVVTGASMALRAQDMRKHKMKKKDVVPMAETALLGFGAAHVILGAIDLIKH